MKPSRPGTPVRERIQRLSIVTPDGCWEWQGRTDRAGYGRIFILQPSGKSQVKIAHRVSYEAFRGPLDESLVLDHLCRNRSCVNPDHLEQVTNLENKIRGLASPAKTECANGHEYNDVNTYWLGNGRKCRVCNRAAAARYAARRASIRGTAA